MNALKGNMKISKVACTFSLPFDLLLCDLLVHDEKKEEFLFVLPSGPEIYGNEKLDRCPLFTC